MKSNDQIALTAKKLMWWQESTVSLAQPPRLIMQVMTLGTWRDVQAVSEAFGWEAFREALLKAEPGIFDERSWAYWHAVFGLPERALPQRSLK